MIIHGPESRVLIGKNVTLDNVLINSNSGDVVIGDGTIFAPNCMVMTGRHVFDADAENYYPWVSEGNNITIERGCWICSGVIIIGGVTIGARSVIGAGSVVTKDIPPDSFAAGNPCVIMGNPYKYR